MGQHFVLKGCSFYVFHGSSSFNVIIVDQTLLIRLMLTCSREMWEWSIVWQASTACFLVCKTSFVVISSDDSSGVTASSPSSFGQVIASGPPVPRVRPAVSMFEVSLISLLYFNQNQSNYHWIHQSELKPTTNASRKTCKQVTIFVKFCLSKPRKYY